MQKLLIIAIIIVNFTFIFFFIRDLLKHKADVMKEPANPIWTPISQIVIFFFSTFGISDFAISTAIFPKAKWVSMKKLPGTLNAQDVIPIFVMSLAYITTVNVGIKMLLVCIVCQVIGAYIGPRFVVKLPENTIRTFVIVGLLVATTLIIAGKVGLIAANGTATELFGWKLGVTGFLLFVYGALNNIGIGSFSLTMATVYAMGMDPIAAFPIMMGGCAFSLPIGSMQFIKLDQYSRKITLFSVFGIIGVLIAVFLVKSIDTSVIQWIVIVVLLYSAYSLHLGNKKAKLID
ncbi:sulfite exporter TauE/SafE family protein [Dellaglioa carnosa]|uniref:sulfite exporter TauE/SafE family protein n=1 Tax=Dellaglioa carnosa TaxID=2995136 RepID=UPI0022A8C4B3|nr:sulfite exporter TauE/SafE family protein [Dellaglioa carnosa]MCZ2492839.1 sulfite exporter TauE/SafE family protein [Dellaglioa carnosa]